MWHMGGFKFQLVYRFADVTHLLGETRGGALASPHQPERCEGETSEKFLSQKKKSCNPAASPPLLSVLWRRGGATPPSFNSCQPNPAGEIPLLSIQLVHSTGDKQNHHCHLLIMTSSLFSSHADLKTFFISVFSFVLINCSFFFFLLFKRLKKKKETL